MGGGSGGEASEAEARRSRAGAPACSGAKVVLCHVPQVCVFVPCYFALLWYLDGPSWIVCACVCKVEKATLGCVFYKVWLVAVLPYTRGSSLIVYGVYVCRGYEAKLIHHFVAVLHARVL